MKMQTWQEALDNKLKTIPKNQRYPFLNGILFRINFVIEEIKEQELKEQK